jgi:2-(1,2-epoxy-1,2-dihydrophenyl)acetyl-CoA isomerase
MNYETLLIEKQAGVGVVTLNRPDVLNAMNPQMGEEMVAAFTTLAADDDTRVVILTGAGRAFCSGADISRTALRRMEPGPNLFAAFNFAIAMPQLMVNYPKPIIAAVNGVAVGVGFTITLPCDIRVASEDARFGAPFTRLGLIPELSSSYFLQRIVGFGKAMELVLTSRIVDAQEAKELGLVNKIAPAGKVMVEALETAKMMLKCSPVALGLARQVLHRAATTGSLQSAEFERLALQVCLKSADHKEAMRAFRYKREPKFIGK